MSLPIIKQQIPLTQGPWKTFEPFLFCVHHQDNYPRGDLNMAPMDSLKGRRIGSDFSGLNGWSMYHGNQVPGFPQHPHRGFETISIVRRGLIDHSDSLGATARIGSGDVQWMTAGSGIVHAEMFPLINQDDRNPTDFFQLWLNLPAARKLTPPEFKMFWNEEVPRVRSTHHDEYHANITVIAGKFGDVTALPPPDASWAAVTEANVAIWLIDLDHKASLTLPKQPHGTTRALYHVEGMNVQLSTETLLPKHAAVLNQEALHHLSAPHGQATVLLLQALPIGEAIVQHGPFVMNSAAEIRDAFYDYRHTQFGGWPWERADPTHARIKGRFARFPNGHEETPPTEKATTQSLIKGVPQDNPITKTHPKNP